MKNLLKPKNDVVFHCLFKKGNEGITKALISAIIEEEITEIELEDRYFPNDYTDEKMGILDLNATLDNGTKCIVEVQLADEGNTEKRILDYWSKKYSSQLGVGEDYNQLSKTILILIVDFNLKVIKDLNKINSKWQIRESENPEYLLTDQLEIHIISLPKAKKKNYDHTKIMQWLTFLDNPNTKEVEKMKEENKDIAEAMDELEKISNDKRKRQEAEMRERWELERRSAENYFKRHGLEEGRKERIRIRNERTE